MNLQSFFSKCQITASKVWNNKYFLPLLFVFSVISLVTHTQLVGMFILLALTELLLIFCDDLMSIVCPVFCILLLSTEFYVDYTVLTPYIPYAVIPFGLALLFNLIYYCKPLVKGRFTKAMIAVSFALLFGGVGVIPVKEYFRPVSLYYTVGLGVGMLIIYLLILSRLQNDREYDRVERLADILYVAGLVASVIVLVFYIRNFDRFLENGSVLYYKPRNYIASVILMTMPASCLLVNRRRIHLLGFAAMCAALAFNGSRSGLLFGAMVGFVCGVYMCYLRKESLKQRRWYNWLFVAIVALLSYVAFKYIPVLYSSRLIDGNFISSSETRVSFIELGMRDFIENPINGIGIGNLKNVATFKAIIPGSIVFYHNVLIQVAGSMGIIGVMAYSLLFGERMRLIITNLHSPSVIFGFSYAAILAMSMTNPGIFCPFPEAGLLTLMFAVMEHESKVKKEIESLQMEETV